MISFFPVERTTTSSTSNDMAWPDRDIIQHLLWDSDTATVTPYIDTTPLSDESDIEENILKSKSRTRQEIRRYVFKR